MKHTINIEIVDIFENHLRARLEFVATCSCQWQGEQTKTRRAAEIDACFHVHDMWLEEVTELHANLNDSAFWMAFHNQSLFLR